MRVLDCVGGRFLRDAIKLHCDAVVKDRHIALESAIDTEKAVCLECELFERIGKSGRTQLDWSQPARKRADLLHGIGEQRRDLGGLGGLGGEGSRGQMQLQRIAAEVNSREMRS